MNHLFAHSVLLAQKNDPGLLIRKRTPPLDIEPEIFRMLRCGNPPELVQRDHYIRRFDYRVDLFAF